MLHLERVHEPGRFRFEFYGAGMSEEQQLFVWQSRKLRKRKEKGDFEIYYSHPFRP